MPSACNSCISRNLRRNRALYVYMSELSEMNAEALAACASVFAGIRQGLFGADDYNAIWETLPENVREYVLGIAAAGRMPVEDNA